jgi:DNA-binding NarL/FixJ family response regulator
LAPRARADQPLHQQRDGNNRIEGHAAKAYLVQQGLGYDPHYLQLLESHYGLRVLLAVVEVGGIPEIAPMLGISEATAKTHLKHVFEKTGVNRQADLVKVVAGFMNPLG